MGLMDKLFGTGKADAQQGKGQQSTTNMTSQEKEKYTAGYNAGKNEPKKK